MFRKCCVVSLQWKCQVVAGVAVSGPAAVHYAGAESQTRSQATRRTQEGKQKKDFMYADPAAIWLEEMNQYIKKK